jgi:hypothetical protein
VSDERVLTNAIDMHVHCGPDIGLCYGDSVEIANIAQEAGMRGALFIDHLTQTVHKATITNGLVTDFECYGAAVMNLPNGGLSPRSAAFFVQLGAKAICLPTIDSEYTWLKADHGHYAAIDATRYAFGLNYRKLTLLNEGIHNGEIRSDVKQIVELVARADIVLFSGHHTPRETITLLEYVNSIGFKGVVISNVNAFLDDFTPDVLDSFVELGAMLEISNGVLLPLNGRQHPREVVKVIKQVGADHVVLVSDAGQLENPSPAEALRSFCQILMKEGITSKEIRTMIVDNPARVLNLEPVMEMEEEK